MTSVTYHRTDSPVESINRKRIYAESKCKRCGVFDQIVDNGEICCRSCGLVVSVTYDHEVASSQTVSLATYKRCFYWNERCSRWHCNEPKIHSDIWDLICREVTKFPGKYPDIKKRCNRTTVSQILRHMKIPKAIMLKHRSQKFKKTLLTRKRLYDKIFEKWKTIRWKLTGVKPVFPGHQLVERMKLLFAASQRPFEIYKHAEDCDRRWNCEKYFGCWHNFVNYDYAFRMFLQICDSDYGFQGSYDMFKEEFPLVSEKVIRTKLRPMFIKICNYNSWTVPPKD